MGLPRRADETLVYCIYAEKIKARPPEPYILLNHIELKPGY